jgi:putative hydrolase
MTDGDSAENFPDNPFGNIPMFGDLAKALAGQGPLNWDAARQFAQLAATDGASEPNPDPAQRFALADLARIVEPHVLDVTGQDVSGYQIATTTPGAWSQQALEAYRPLFTELAVSLGKRPSADADADDDDALTDPMMAMMAGLSKMMAPSMLGMAIGSMVGRLGKRAFGQYDLPIPRPESKSVALVPANIDSFAESWSLPRDSMRLWVLVHELTTHAVFSVAHIREGLSDLVRSHVGAFEPDPSAVAEKLTSLDMDTDDPMQALQKTLGDPEILLGAVRSPAQIALQPRLDAAMSAIIGYIDHVVDTVTSRLIGGDARRISEAVRRRRIETAPDDVFVERLLGLHLTRQQVERGRAFIAGVIERGGPTAINALLDKPGSIPTPSELEAPGLWLARLEFD